MTEHQYEAIKSLRDDGYAIAMFAPEELGNADVHTVEDLMVERGWNAIETLRTDKDDDDDED